MHADRCRSNFFSLGSLLCSAPPLVRNILLHGRNASHCELGRWLSAVKCRPLSTAVLLIENVRWMPIFDVSGTLAELPNADVSTFSCFRLHKAPATAVFYLFPSSGGSLDPGPGAGQGTFWPIQPYIVTLQLDSDTVYKFLDLQYTYALRG